MGPSRRDRHRGADGDGHTAAQPPRALCKFRIGIAFELGERFECRLARDAAERGRDLAPFLDPTRRDQRRREPGAPRGRCRTHGVERGQRRVAFREGLAFEDGDERVGDRTLSFEHRAQRNGVPLCAERGREDVRNDEREPQTAVDAGVGRCVGVDEACKLHPRSVVVAGGNRDECTRAHDDTLQERERVGTQSVRGASMRGTRPVQLASAGLDGGDHRARPELVDRRRLVRVREWRQQIRDVTGPADQPLRPGHDQVVARIARADTGHTPPRRGKYLALAAGAVRAHHHEEVGGDLPLGRDRAVVDATDLFERGRVVPEGLGDDPAAS